MVRSQCRHLADPATKTTAQLRPALFSTQLLTMIAHFEPACFGACRVDLPHWPKIIGVIMPLVTRIAVLESLLEGAADPLSLASLWPVNKLELLESAEKIIAHGCISDALIFAL